MRVVYCRELCVLVLLWVGSFAGGCRRAVPPPPLVPQTSGTVEIPGLSAPVRVVRDTWGVAHIYAQSQADLFAAQGFVQAEDRLFQMDLWRRSVQGRLSQVLGPNFVERDAMTRRVQYAGPLAVEWDSYGADAQSIAAAFVRGINAWVARARDRRPEEFVRAGWTPEFWAATDVLNRTDAFLASADAVEEVHRRGLSPVVAEAIRRVGTAPFFATTFQVPATEIAVRSGGGARASANAVVLREAWEELHAPSPRYLVHLNAPGWNVIGVASPWRPGVAAGHNARIAWAPAPIDLDTEDVFADVDATVTRGDAEAIVIKGRRQPFVFTRDATPHGVVVASDRGHHVAYTLRWSGTEPGAAPELAALAIDRAGDWEAFRVAAGRWKMPPRRLAYADRDGNVGFQDAALVPIRRGAEWIGWVRPDDLPHAIRLRGGSVVVDRPDRPGGVAGEALFDHVLATSAATAAHYNVGPLPLPADDSQVALAIDVREWDRSMAINAPGQSAWTAASHYSDGARAWSNGQSFPLVFSDQAVQANTETTLMLLPSARR